MIENFDKSSKEEFFAKVKSNDLNWEKLREKIVYRIIGENKMEEYVLNARSRVLNKPIDYKMYVVYTVEVADNMSMVITENVAREMKCDIEDIDNLAMINTEKMYPPVLKNLESAIVETMTGSLCNRNLLDVEGITLGLHEQNQMHVLTNSRGKYGASVIKYRGLLDKIGNIFADDYYMIPSSVHEFILLPRGMDIGIRELEFILNDVNEGFVKKNEILGSRVLMYSREKGRITTFQKR